MPVQNNKFPPALRFYTSLRRSSLLQGNAPIGARLQKLYFIFTVGREKYTVIKPDRRGRPSFFCWAIANGRTESLQETRTFNF